MIEVVHLSPLTQIRNYQNNYPLPSNQPAQTGPRFNVPGMSQSVKEVNNSPKVDSKINFTTCEILKHIFCHICTRNKKHTKYTIYQNTKSFIFERLDVRNVIKNVVEYGKFKKILLDQIQQKMFSYVNKIPVSEFSLKLHEDNATTTDSLFLLKQKILKIKHNHQDTTDIDRRLLGLMTEEVKQYILQY